jgi:acyl transferase domain-containing protein/NADPH:quinone reductase-like Zn-dependent oxidoreductase/acyl carrier protein
MTNSEKGRGKTSGAPNESLSENRLGAMEPVAIIGLACRFPGAPNATGYWNLLRDGVDAITDIPDDRWLVDAFYDEAQSAEGRMYTRKGGFIDDVYDFDPQFFGIAPREVDGIDPQHRVLLELAWEALEDAAIPPTDLSGTRTGVFIGASTHDHMANQARLNPVTEVDAYTALGSAACVGAGRLSYLLGLQGPNFTVDTACSSSLVALHLAGQSLNRSECDSAICLGVTLTLSPEPIISFCKAGTISRKGSCSTFDASADGYARSEGCGAVVLKRLADARTDGDRILAVVRGTAINHDGRSSGLTAPSRQAQERVLTDALASAGLAPEDVGYVEAHGTGTPLGDPIEIQALGAVMAKDRPRTRPLLVGSAKTNVGHLEAAAGMAGLAKVILALQNEQIPPHLHFKNPNPHIPWDELAIEITSEGRPWHANERPRIAGLSSFGLSGTNAHILIEEAPAAPEPPENTVDRSAHILCLSAKSDGALKELAGQVGAVLEQDDAPALADLAHMANAGRSHFTHRLAVIGEDGSEAAGGLAAFAAGKRSPKAKAATLRDTQPPKVAFLFTGQGSQYVGMGRQLYDTQPTFKRIMDECDEILRGSLDKPLLSVLHPKPEEVEEAERLLTETTYAQPALFTIEIALAQLWRSWGVEPTVVMGHSAGEHAAACVAGIFNLEDALKFVAKRGRLTQELDQDGTMASVFATEARVLEAIAPYTDDVAIAAVNGPKSTVISGERKHVELILEQLAAEDIQHTMLNVSNAFHSPLVEPMMEKLRHAAQEVTFREPNVSMLSCLTGKLAPGGEAAQPDYWAQLVRRTVRFNDAMQVLDERGYSLFLEMGPQPNLLFMARQCVENKGQRWLPALRQRGDDWTQVLKTMQELYLGGVPVDWKGFDRDYHRKRVSLPTYPFQRKTFRKERSFQTGSAPLDAGAEGSAASHPLLGKRVRAAGMGDVIFENRFSERGPVFLPEHRMYGMVVAPGASHLAMALTAGTRLYKHHRVDLENLLFPEALMIQEGEARTVQFVMAPEKEGSRAFQILSAPVEADEDPWDAGEKAWALHARGALSVTPLDQLEGVEPELRPPALNDVLGRCTHHFADAKMFYQLMEQQGVQLGARFQWMAQLWRCPGESLGQMVPMLDALITSPKGRKAEGVTSEADDYALYPGIIDACFQFMSAALPPDEIRGDAYIPFSVERFRFYGSSPNRLYLHAVLRPADQKEAPPSERGPRTYTADMCLFDEKGAVVAEIFGASLRRAPKELLARFARRHLKDWFYTTAWLPARLKADPEDAPEYEKGSWLIVAPAEAEPAGVASALKSLLVEKGQSCTLARLGEPFSVQGEGTCTVDPGNPADFERLLAEGQSSEAEPLRGVVFIAGSSPNDDGDLESFEGIQETSTCAVLHLLRALAKGGKDATPRLWMATSEALPATDDTHLRLSQAPMVGLSRVIASEHPDLRCVRVDLPGDAKPETAAACLAQELWADDGENEVAYRLDGAVDTHSDNGRSGAEPLIRFATRLVRQTASSAKGGGASSAYRLVRSEQGVLQDLALSTVDRIAPGPGLVEIEVRASGLNFRDVLNALNLYPGDPGPLGLECTGVVSAVGAGIEGLAVGDRVLAFGPGCLSQYVTTDAHLVVPIPDELDLVGGATIPVTFVTAYCALHELAKLGPGDRVLIHAAAGGVGLAAVQLARAVGAEVYATAGAPEKHDLLHSLGVEHVFSSRSLEFADDVMRATDGKGVTVVLNSLKGDFIPKSLSVLSENGRFVEIGKIDSWTPERVEEERPDVAYWLFALDDMTVKEPAVVGRLLREMMGRFATGELKPLPSKTFGIHQAGDAFRYMAQARHAGKIVLTHDPEEAKAGTRDSVSVCPDGTYLITGGLGGLGLQIARLFARQGAGQVVLIGRSEPGETARAAMEEMATLGTVVHAMQADVSKREDVARVLEEIDRRTQQDPALPPLRGVVHAAGILGDGVLREMEWDAFWTVMAPKALGAVHLHELTKERPLDMFVLFSSVAALFGPVGQGNYAAANAFLDSLAHYRNGRGLAAQSINWGPWSDVGMAANTQSEVHRQWNELGIGSISPSQGLTTFEMLLDDNPVQACVLPVNWAKFFQRLPAGAAPPLLLELSEEGGRKHAKALEPTPEWLQFVEEVAATPEAERQGMVIAYLQEQAASVQGLDSTEQLLATTPLYDLGFDSLMAVELANHLGATAGANIPATLLFDYPTLDAMAGYVLKFIMKLDGVSVRKGDGGVEKDQPAEDHDSAPVHVPEEEAERTEAAEST